ncbi:multiple PDZ domain protein-like isoform X2 [Homarus americanus]|uniref:multiple PDZ domain protein-like isoform X2 n=1 Tax=Homarus americanus TaxID=6706 RepID=UPI001C48DC60|nr:multiple PDZ domain protein-like isoform X2 [Homarus americanus]
MEIVMQKLSSCCCCFKRRHSDGERVVEVYGGVAAAAAHAHNTTAAVSGRGTGHVEPVRPQPVDPALLTSLDLESDHQHHTRDMLVTDAQPQPAYPHRSHDLNHNNHVYAHKPPEDVSHVSGRAAKYVVSGSNSLGGHDNFGFDSELSGQDNYGYDPGYSSERSPEEEEGPPLYCHSSQDSNNSSGSEKHHGIQQQEHHRSLKLPSGQILTTHELMKLFPFINEGTIFEVTVIKNLRGLGLAVTGGIECDVPYAGLIRIKKLYPQTPAWLCGQLEVGDILLHANTQPLTGLSSHEALEMLRTAEREVTLEMCRPPRGALGEGEDTTDGGSGLGVVTTSLIAPNTSHNYLSPSPSFSSCGEFEVELTKVAGSLGFTLRKQDNSILGHIIRSLVKEPAISDGRLRPGDKIISVNNTNMCNLSHEEAIAFLRTCPETVTLKLYRDAMQTPVSPASPTEPDVILKPKALRKEARDMLTDLAMRKQSPGNSLSLVGATSSPGTPRRRRLQKTPSPDIKSVVVDRWDSLVRKTEESLPGSPILENKMSLNSIRETDHETSPFGDSQTDDSTSTTIRSRNSSAASSCSLTPSSSESSRPKRPSFLDLSNGRSCPRKTQFTPPHEVDHSFPSPLGAQYPSADSLDSAPQLTSAHSDTPAFSHLHQGYHSVNLGALHQHEDLTLTNTTSDHNISGHENEGPSNNGLLKWKGIVFTPDEEDSTSTEESVKDDDSTGGSPKSQKPKMVTLELNRGWNSRLGFSLQPQGDETIITAIYADSVAAKDGRLNIGDIIVKVNGVDVVGWDSESVIDFLRKTRGKISLTVLQQPT